MKIAVLIRQTIRSTSGCSGLGFMAQRQPVAIVIVTTSGHHIVHLEKDTGLLLDEERIQADISSFVANGPVH
ncbi:MAG: hypothetical protein NXI27_04335 [Alphaproteobacteria bacterium]|nr:hypothetical protein [Alphaproteobacteria bacterium]